jgi:hypothetical protein
MSNIDITFFKSYANLTVPEGLSKSKEGFFNGVLDAINNPTSIDKVRATNIAKKWSNILNNHQNEDVLTTARDAGFDDALWAHFADFAGFSFEKANQRTETRQRTNEPAFSGNVKMTVSDLLTKDDGYEYYEVSTPLLDMDVEGCYLRKIADRQYGFRISAERLEEMFDSGNVSGEHVFYIEWNYSRRDSSFIHATIKSVNDELEPTIHPRVFKERKQRSKPQVVYELLVPFDVSENDDGTFRLSSKMFKYPKDDDGNQLYLRKIGEGVCGFSSIPVGVMERLFKDVDDYTGTHTFNVIWKKMERDGRTKFHSSIASVEDGFETNLQYYKPRKVYKKRDVQEETSTTEPIETNEVQEEE